eukprot:607742-Pelagomonas_calceolata.AAC.1
MACSSAVKGVNGVPCLKLSVSESWLRQFFSVACEASPTCPLAIRSFYFNSDMRVTHMLYADDLCPSSNLPDQLQLMLDRLHA